MVIHILIVMALILGNGLFSMAEFGLVSSRRTRLELRARHGDAGAKAALALLHEPTRFLSTVQIGITLLSVVEGAFGGKALAGDVSRYIVGLPLVGRYADAASMALVVSLITFASLLFGELVPKRVALQNPEAFAAALATPTRSLSRAAAPAVRLLTLATDLVVKPFGVARERPNDMTSEEIRDIITQGQESGAVGTPHAEVLMRAFRAGDRHVGEVMTPRVDIVWIPHTMTLSTFLEFNSRQFYSHFPVRQGDADDFVGVLAVKDVVRATGAGRLAPTDPVSKLMQPPFFVPETKGVLDLINEMRRDGKSLALVVDEFGGLSGLVTYKQLVGEVVGQVRQEGEGEAVRAAGAETVHVVGSLRIIDANEQLALDLPEGDYETVAGFILQRLGKIPIKNDRVVHGTAELVVAETKGPRIQTVTIVRRQPAGKG